MGESKAVTHFRVEQRNSEKEIAGYQKHLRDQTASSYTVYHIISVNYEQHEGFACRILPFAAAMQYVDKSLTVMKGSSQDTEFRRQAGKATK